MTIFELGALGEFLGAISLFTSQLSDTGHMRATLYFMAIREERVNNLIFQHNQGGSGQQHKHTFPCGKSEEFSLVLRRLWKKSRK
jgi:hypothetical protein